MFEIISAIVIPFVIQLLKKIKLPTKIAPIVAVILATIIVAGAKIAGIDLDVKSTTDVILKILGIAGGSVLAYDTVKKLTEK